jgi:hypothetical protein
MCDRRWKGIPDGEDHDDRDDGIPAVRAMFARAY